MLQQADPVLQQWWNDIESRYLNLMHLKTQAHLKYVIIVVQLVSNFLTMMTMWWQAREHDKSVTNTTVKVKSSRQCNTNPPLWKLSVNSPDCSTIFCDLWGKQSNYVLYYVWASWWKAACQRRWHNGISDKLYSRVKVPHGSNNPNISDYLAFIMLVSLKHYLNVGYWLSMGNII